MSDETALMNELRIHASELGARLIRQNTGVAWVGRTERGPKTVRLGAGDVAIRAARRFHAGFPGWSDLGGWSPVLIAPEHVGRTLAVYTQAEVKDGARVTDEQTRWIDLVNRAGGLAGVVRSRDDLAALLGRLG